MAYGSSAAWSKKEVVYTEKLLDSDDIVQQLDGLLAPRDSSRFRSAVVVGGVQGAIIIKPPTLNELETVLKKSLGSS